MTAEVAILNKQSVALAADSAVTTSDLKIFNTAKLFALSKQEPVGIMAYSSAEVMGVPVETVIKEFRRIRGPQRWDHLEQYAEDFARFLREDDRVFSKDGRVLSLSTLACGLINEIYRRTGDKLMRDQVWGHPTKKDAQDALSDAIADVEQRVEGAGVVQVAQPRKARSLVSEAIDKELTEALGELKKRLPVSTRAEARIRKLVIDHFFRDVDADGETGFVIAGFGTADVFPRLRAFEFHYSALGLRKMRNYAEVDISLAHTAQIIPFGQKDVMATFVEGIDPRYTEKLLSFIDTYLTDQKSMLLAETPPKVSEAMTMEALGQELVQRLPGALKGIANEAFVWPTMQVVASMPKEELAILAEALVNLTALKRKASTDAETVGGPTDVAVISKGDGFIWIKRKHYFDLKFNPAFVAGRIKESKHEDSA